MSRSRTQSKAPPLRRRAMFLIDIFIVFVLGGDRAECGIAPIE